MESDKFFKKGVKSKLGKDEPDKEGTCGCPKMIGKDNEESVVHPCVRYAAYANRIRTALRSGSRYLAYTSDVGESFRPVIPRFFVRLAYGISWSYVIIDVSYHSWKAKVRREGRYVPGLMPWNTLPPPNAETAAAAADERGWKVVAVKELFFQSIASMGLPAFTIHTVVAHSGFLYKNFRNVNVKRFGPVATGLAIVPFLPFMYDKPVEEVIEWITVKAENFYEKRHNNKK